MVLGRIIIPIGIVAVLVVVGFFLFKKFNIGQIFQDALSGLQKFGEDVAKGAADITEQISQAVGDTGQAIQDSVDDAGDFIFQAGVDSRVSFDETTKNIVDAFTDFFFPSTENADTESELNTIADFQQIDEAADFVGNKDTIQEVTFEKDFDPTNVLLPDEEFRRRTVR